MIARRLTFLFYRNSHPGLRTVNSFAEYGLFPITFKKLARMSLVSGFRVLALKEMHFQLHVLTRIPVIREAVPSVVFILQK
jgi:hypothetical protein